MKYLVTGANGLLGKVVVQELLDRGHEVRAIVRPTCQIQQLPWFDRVQFIKADLRNATDLESAFEGVDCLIHLAAMISGSDEAQFMAGPVATERLLAAMARCSTRNLVLCSSFSVYDWSKAWFVLDERCPVEQRGLYRRDGYAIAKVWQERVARDYSQQHAWGLTILRPGFIWGHGNEWCSGAGLETGRRILVNGPFRRLPLTYSENCAQAFAVAAEAAAASQETAYHEEIFNVIDSDNVRAWRFAGDYLLRSGQQKRRIPLPDFLFRATANCAALICRVSLGRNWKLPGLFMPNRYTARFGSRRFPADKLREKRGWRPRFTYAEALERTYRRPVAKDGAAQVDSSSNHVVSENSMAI